MLTLPNYKYKVDKMYLHNQAIWGYTKTKKLNEVNATILEAEFETFPCCGIIYIHTFILLRSTVFKAKSHTFPNKRTDAMWKLWKWIDY